MWYLGIMCDLLYKLPEASREKGKSFLNDLFIYNEKLGIDEIEFYLGLIDKSYLINNKIGEVSFDEFSAYILGLTLLYAKHTKDLAVWNEDFLPFCNTHVLNLKINHLCDIESNLFARLEHNVKIDFDHLISIFKSKTPEIHFNFIEACKKLDQDKMEPFNQLINASAVNLQFAFRSDEKPTFAPKTLLLDRLSIFKSITKSTDDKIVYASTDNDKPRTLP